MLSTRPQSSVFNYRQHTPDYRLYIAFILAHSPAGPHVIESSGGKCPRGSWMLQTHRTALLIQIIRWCLHPSRKRSITGVSCVICSRDPVKSGSSGYSSSPGALKWRNVILVWIQTTFYKEIKYQAEIKEITHFKLCLTLAAQRMVYLLKAAVIRSLIVRPLSVKVD